MSGINLKKILAAVSEAIAQFSADPDKKDQKIAGLLAFAGQTFKSTDGQRYRVDALSALVRPRRIVGDGYARKITGAKMVRVDPDGERIPRARQMVPGLSGKQYRRRMRA